jgi:GNAT superfamily N-acetyltransferase
VEQVNVENRNAETQKSGSYGQVMQTLEQIRIRKAGDSDAALLAELGRNTFYESFAAYNRPHDMAAYMSEAFDPGTIAAELADPRSLFFIAEIDGEPVGYAKLHDGEPAECVAGPSPIELNRLYVKHEWHGRGVGAALMNACLDRARNQQHQTIWLGVWEHNPRALAFYRKGGFVEIGEHPFQFGSDRQTDIVMQRSV